MYHWTLYLFALNIYYYISAHLLPAIGLLCLAFLGCNVVLSVVVLTFAVAMVGAFSCGFFQNPLDIAPNFAGKDLRY
jgi:hypothetical protein